MDEAGGHHHDPFSLSADKEYGQFSLPPGEDNDLSSLELYQMHILQKTGASTKLNLLSHQVSESVFRECFQPGGDMNPSILFLQCELWK